MLYRGTIVLTIVLSAAACTVRYVQPRTGVDNPNEEAEKQEIMGIGTEVERGGGSRLLLNDPDAQTPQVEGVPICLRILSIFRPVGCPARSQVSIVQHACLELKDRAICRILAEPEAPQRLKRTVRVYAMDIERVFGLSADKLTGLSLICFFDKRPGLVFNVIDENQMKCIEKGMDESLMLKKFRELLKSYRSRTWIGIVELHSKVFSGEGPEDSRYVGKVIAGPPGRENQEIVLRPHPDSQVLGDLWKKELEYALKEHIGIILELPRDKRSSYYLGGPGEARCFGGVGVMK